MATSPLGGDVICEWPQTKVELQANYVVCTYLFIFYFPHDAELLYTFMVCYILMSFIMLIFTHRTICANDLEKLYDILKIAAVKKLQTSIFLPKYMTFIVRKVQKITYFQQRNAS